ncbi:hypothetical protein ACOBV9_19815 (plasmid) [Pseudoalteromonas espejiana]
MYTLQADKQAPGSAAWQGTKTTALRAKQLPDLGTITIVSTAERLGITFSRYLMFV